MPRFLLKRSYFIDLNFIWSPQKTATSQRQSFFSSFEPQTLKYLWFFFKVCQIEIQTNKKKIFKLILLKKGRMELINCCHNVSAELFQTKHFFQPILSLLSTLILLLTVVRGSLINTIAVEPHPHLGDHFLSWIIPVLIRTNNLHVRIRSDNF